MTVRQIEKNRVVACESSSTNHLEEQTYNETDQAFLEGYKYAIQILEQGLVNIKKTK